MKIISKVIGCEKIKKFSKTFFDVNKPFSSSCENRDVKRRG